MGGTLSHRGHMCKSCDCFVQDYSHKGGKLLVFVRKEACKADSHGSGGHHIWLNKTMLPAWRDRAMKIKKHETMEWEDWLAEVFYVKFPDLKGVLKDGEIVSKFTDSTIAYHDCPEPAQALYNNNWDRGFLIEENGNPRKRYRIIGDHISLPDDLVDPLYPTHVPSIEGVSIWAHLQGRMYIPVDHAKSWRMPVPEDPILVSNREFFKEVREQVLKELTLDNADHPLYNSMMSMLTVKNQYGGIEPWYTFTIMDVEFVIGWRKRVVSITAKSKALPFYITDITKLAERDSVTYSADDKYSPVDSMAHQVSIHAWGKEKCIEYLVTVIKAVANAHTTHFSRLERLDPTKENSNA